MAIANIQNINIGLPNESVGSDSLYTAFNKVNNNFATLFSCASPYCTFVGSTGIAASANSTTNIVTITNTGVTQLNAGTGITLSGTTGNITISSTGGGGSGVTSVGLAPVNDTRLTVTGSPIVSSGIMTVDLATVPSITPGTYINPSVTVDAYGRVIDASSGTTFTSLSVTGGTGISVANNSSGGIYQFTVTNTGVTSLVAGSGISLSGSTGAVTVSSNNASNANYATYSGTAFSVDAGNINGVVNLANYATTANSVAGANVSGAVAYATTANAVAGANVTGQVSFANVANHVAAANVTGIGNIATVNLDGNTSNILSGSGTWVSAGAVGGQPGGSNTQVQFNNSGAFAGNSHFTYDVANAVMAVFQANVNFEYIIDPNNATNWMWMLYNSPTQSFQIASWSSNISLSVNGQQQIYISGPNVDIHGSLNLSPSGINAIINSANTINLTSNSHTWSFSNVGDLSLPNGNISNANVISANTFVGMPFTKTATWQSSSGAITTPIIDIPVYIPVNCTIKGVTILTRGGSGSCVTDIWKTPVGSYPPSSGNSICGGNYPTISSGVTLVDTTLTSWTKTVSAGDTIMFHLTSSSTFTYITLQLTLVTA